MSIKTGVNDLKDNGSQEMQNTKKLEQIHDNSSKEERLARLRKEFPKVNLYNYPFVGTEDVRQHVYCPRIIYFRHVLKAPMIKTFKMSQGEEKHEKLQGMKKDSQEKGPDKYYNVYLTDSRLGLVGLIDYFEFDGHEAYPVEIKSGRSPPQGMEDPHKYQVTAQALLIEVNFDFLVKKVRVYYSKQDKVIDYSINAEDKLKVMEIVRKIQQVIMKETIPPPTSDQGKCVDCECKLYCLRA